MTDVATCVPPIQIVPGLPKGQHRRAARLYWSAFSGKLGKTLGPDEKGIAFVERVIDPDFAISAVDAQGQLVGLAGFKTSSGALLGGGVADLVAVYGWLGVLWRLPLLATIERELEDGILLMDGIMVAQEARGQGIGTDLLDAIKARAPELGCRSVRLDVVDTNPRARQLYEREGFVAGQVTRLGPLRYLFGFRSSVTMIWTSA